MDLVKRKAQNNVKNGMVQLKRWWTNKYKLPASHALFENQSSAELYLEFFEDMFAQRQEILASLEEEGNQVDQERAYKQLNAINRALDLPEVVSDPLIDKWERELAEGKEPDFEETLGDYYA